MNKLDLNKIEVKLDTLLENETTESLTNWLKEKRDKNNNMAQQIEPITIPFKKNWGEYLFVFQSYPFTASNQVMAEILDKDRNLLYSIMLNATSYEDVAQQLGLTLIKHNNMAQTAMQELINWAISIKDNEQQCIDWIVIKSKAEELLKLEKEQMHKCASFWRGKENDIEKPIFEIYYKENFNK